jgi:hypothetical protein
MFGDFKQTMIKDFEMTDIGLMYYYLGIEIKQGENKIFRIKRSLQGMFSRSLIWRIVQE